MKTTRFGLITRIAMLVICVEVAAFGVLGWFYIDRFSTAADENIRSRLHLVGRMIGNDELAVTAISRQSLMSELLAAPYQQGMAIGRNGRVIVATDMGHLGRPAAEIPGFDAQWLAELAADQQFLSHGDLLTSVSRIRNDSTRSHIYTTVITVSTAGINAQKRSVILWGVLGSALFVLLSSLAIVLIAQRLITRRVAASLDVLKEVESGVLDARIPVSVNDELGQIQLGINSMTEKVSELLNQHRRSEEEIRATSQLLNSIVENIPNMLFLKRASDLRFVLFNKAGEQLLGLDRQKLLGKSDQDLFTS